MDEKDEIIKKKKWGFLKKYLTKKVIGVIAILLAIVAVLLGVKNYALSESKTTKLGFEDIGELATQSAYCTDVNVTDECRKLFGIKIPFTQSKYIYSYDVVIKAGIDFKEVEWDVDEKNKAITVKLPETKVLSSDIDMDSFKLYHEDESVFRQISMTENNEALKKMKQTAEEDAIGNGLLDNARSNAETILKGFFANAYDMNEYTIEFKDK